MGRQLRQRLLERLDPPARERHPVARTGQAPGDRPPDPDPAPVTIATGARSEVLMRRFSVIVAPTCTSPLSSTVVGSYPQPEWLIDRAALGSHSVPRVRMTDAWRIPEPYLQEAQDDATVVAIRDMERAGIDTITDGEIRRESYSNRFATALDGIDADNPATIHTRGGEARTVPRIVGPVRWRGRRRGRRHRVPARSHRPRDQDHAARSVHDGPAGEQRGLR